MFFAAAGETDRTLLLGSDNRLLPFSRSAAVKGSFLSAGAPSSTFESTVTFGTGGGGGGAGASGILFRFLSFSCLAFSLSSFAFLEAHKMMSKMKFLLMFGNELLM